MIRRVRRYQGLVAAAVLLVSVGVGTGTPTLLLAGIVPLAFVVQGALSTLQPLDEQVRVEREVRPETPLPGQPVEVTLTVTNVGASILPDLRVRDGVPEELAIREGAASAGAALRPGESVTAEYTLTANRGRYAFQPVRLRASSVSGTVVAETTREADGPGAFECRIDAEDVPLRRRTTAFSGSLATDTGGVGVEFHATRDYRAGDPVSRINWRRYAKTGELSTVEYREQRAARVAVLIDGRDPNHVAAGASLPTGATLCAYAGTLAVRVLRDEGHHVGVGALGPADPITGRRPAWVPPDADGFAAHAAAVCNAAATGAEEAVTARTTPAATTRATTDGGRDAALVRFLGHLPATAQVILCTPALDDAVASMVETIRTHGHETTVLSPAVTPESVGGRTLALERGIRLDRMREVGATVVDWDREERLPVALARTLQAGGTR
ncbi:DUF58 domain-containing protein [Haloplanus aerogenes]|uniref:DUF58 domain-containing protein n=1 Tax=Haloplanus aerogenes TaxID=660522 RepID=A0A3M0DX94_9EURY|nr:DUF58 domain-containing protein [Haloplanus aerogenes]AZH24198.1 DUF58 domain-containing protein [Haloplanus aerogenes]RMB24179.1 uncharacterized protein (DUF58 family) [Haloplanus aerogenes]